MFKPGRCPPPPPEKPHPATLIDINRMMSEGWKATIRTAPTGGGGGGGRKERESL